MIVEVIMPKVGMYEADVALVAWLVPEGAQVQVGDPLFVMETDKVETEIEAEDDGFLVHEAQPDFTAPVGTRIGYLASSHDEYLRLTTERGQP